MKRILLLSSLLFSFALLINSCNSGSNISTSVMESRLIGDWWRFEKACFNPKGAAPKKDVTFNWENYKMRFNYDYSLDLFDLKTQDTSYGYWWIYEDWQWDEEDQENELVQTIEITVYDETALNSRTMLWKDPYVGTDKIKATEKTTEGKYLFELER